MALPETLANRQLDALYLDHNSWLQAWLRRHLGDASTAADLAQDTFLRVWLKSRSGAGLTLEEPRAYLATVARRLLINHVERQSLERAFAEAVAALPESFAPSPEEQAMVLETLHEVDALLNQLPVPVRTAFLMSQLEGASYDTIAAHLQVSVRTVTRYMAQAFRHCLQLMLSHS